MIPTTQFSKELQMNVPSRDLSVFCQLDFQPGVPTLARRYFSYHTTEERLFPAHSSTHSQQPKFPVKPSGILGQYTNH